MKKLFDYDCVVQGDKAKHQKLTSRETSATAQKEAK